METIISYYAALYFVTLVMVTQGSSPNSGGPYNVNSPAQVTVMQTMTENTRRSRSRSPNNTELSPSEIQSRQRQFDLNADYNSLFVSPIRQNFSEAILNLDPNDVKQEIENFCKFCVFFNSINNPTSLSPAEKVKFDEFKIEILGNNSNDQITVKGLGELIMSNFISKLKELLNFPRYEIFANHDIICGFLERYFSHLGELEGFMDELELTDKSEFYDPKDGNSTTESD